MNWMSTSFCNKSKRRDQKLVKNRRLQVLVEIFARASILIEDKQVWIVIADMEKVVHARGSCTRRLDKAMKHLEQLVPFFRLGVQIRDQGASRRHVVLPD